MHLTILTVIILYNFVTFKMSYLWFFGDIFQRTTGDKHNCFYIQ